MESLVYGIIYKAANTLNGKVYVGQTTKTLNRRKSDHKYMALKGDRRSSFQCALLDEGFDNFAWEQIDTADTQAELDAKEKYWIAHYDSMNPEKGYNGTDGGIHCKASPETLQRKSEVMKGEKNPMYGKHLSEETRRKMSEVRKGEKNPFFGKHHSTESNRKNGEAHLGKTPWNKGIPITEEQREKVRKNRRGKTAGEKHPSVKINEKIAAEIKHLFSVNKNTKQIVEFYNGRISKHIVNDIKRGKTWGWVNAG
jgi:group I intron endonuclease